MKMRQTVNDQWWNSLSTGEKDFLRLLMTLIRGAKNSHSAEVASAARHWESGLACFIKTRLRHRRAPIQQANPST
jgi:hypothetical protein